MYCDDLFVNKYSREVNVYATKNVFFSLLFFNVLIRNKAML